MPNKSQKWNHGFTLIELLITITLIGILSGIVAMAMVNPQKEARDARRKSDLELIRSGLEIYNADCGKYPTTASFPLSTATSLSGSGTCANIYITAVPKDPTSGRNYSYVSAGTTYTLCANLEMPSSTTLTCGSCGSAGACDYGVTNP
jgi:general secretion pathway protein G